MRLSHLHYTTVLIKRQQNKLALISVDYLQVPLFTPTFPICFIHLLKLMMILMHVSTAGKLPHISYGWIDEALTWWRFLEISLLNNMYGMAVKETKNLHYCPYCAIYRQHFFLSTSVWKYRAVFSFRTNLNWWFLLKQKLCVWKPIVILVVSSESCQMGAVFL